jgi:hypothetical protein
VLLTPAVNAPLEGLLSRCVFLEMFPDDVARGAVPSGRWRVSRLAFGATGSHSIQNGGDSGLWLVPQP